MANLFVAFAGQQEKQIENLLILHAGLKQCREVFWLVHLADIFDEFGFVALRQQLLNAM